MRIRIRDHIRSALRRLEVGHASLVAATIGAMFVALSMGSCIMLPVKMIQAEIDRSEESDAASRAAARSAEPVLRVRLQAGVDGTTIAGPTQVMVKLAARTIKAQQLTTPITVAHSEGVWRVTDAQRTIRAFAPVGEAERAGGLSIEGVGATPLTLGKASYPGSLLLVASKDRGPARTAGARTPGDAQVGANAAGEASAAAAAPPSPTQFDVLELVEVEAYLPGVVAKELPSGWELTAYKVQAIIARSYALHERDRAAKTNRNYDIESGESDQVYMGVSADPRIQQAVRETRGQALMFQGHVLRAYYSSTCGGRASSAKDVWPTTSGFEFNLDAPLQGHAPDEYCAASPLYRWTVVRNRDDLTKRITAYGRDTGLGVRNLKSFSGASPSAFNTYGRPTQYKVFDSDGKWWPLSAEQLRTACNWTGSSGRPAVTRQERVNSGDAVFNVQGDKVTIAGRGFGHGVGVCQYGVEGMAKLGRGVDSILLFYYPGAKIERLY